MKKDHFLARYGVVDTPENHEFMRVMGDYNKNDPRWAKNRDNYHRALLMVTNSKAPVEFARHTIHSDFFGLSDSAMHHPGLTPEDLEPHLQNPNNNRHWPALRHPNVSTEQLDGVIQRGVSKGKYMELSDEKSVGLAVQHPNVAKHHIEWAAKHSNPSMRAHVALRSDLDPQTRTKLGADPVQKVRAANGIGSMAKEDRSSNFVSSVRAFLHNNELASYEY